MIGDKNVSWAVEQYRHNWMLVDELENEREAKELYEAEYMQRARTRLVRIERVVVEERTHDAN